jgi:hypothetical protein
VSRQISATARDRRKTFIAQNMLFILIKWKLAKKNQFFSSLNQYFPHIPYMASKNEIFGTTPTKKYLGRVRMPGVELSKKLEPHISRLFIGAILHQNTKFSAKSSPSKKKVRKPWQIWWIFSLQDVLERKKLKNVKKNSMKLVR